MSCITYMNRDVVVIEKLPDQPVINAGIFYYYQGLGTEIYSQFFELSFKLSKAWFVVIKLFCFNVFSQMVNDSHYRDIKPAFGNINIQEIPMLFFHKFVFNYSKFIGQFFSIVLVLNNG